MQQDYKPLYNQAKNLQFRVQDITSGIQSPTTISLHSEIHQLNDDIDMKKNPREIESRITNIQTHLRSLEGTPQSVMDINHSMELHDEYETLRRQVKELPGY